MEAIREVGQDRAQHGGDHSIDEDGENGSEYQHAAAVLSVSVFIWRNSTGEHRPSRESDGSGAQNQGWRVVAGHRQTLDIPAQRPALRSMRRSGERPA